MDVPPKDIGWTDDVEHLCENTRRNTIILERLHKRNYFKYKSTLKYFRIPNIILNSINSVLAVAMTSYVSQQVASTTNCAISLFIAIIGSLEAYFNIQKNMESELIISKDCYILAVEIFTTLQLSRERRTMSGMRYLEEVMGKYEKLIEKSSLYEKKIQDQLIPIDSSLMRTKPLSTPRRSFTGPTLTKSKSSMMFEMIDTSSSNSEDNNV